MKKVDKDKYPCYYKYCNNDSNSYRYNEFMN